MTSGSERAHRSAPFDLQGLVNVHVNVKDRVQCSVVGVVGSHSESVSKRGIRLGAGLFTKWDKAVFGLIRWKVNAAERVRRDAKREE